MIKIALRKQFTYNHLVMNRNLDGAESWSRMRYARTVSVLILCLPRYSNTFGSFPQTWSCTLREMQMPPGSARDSNLPAILTPSP